MKLHFLLPAFLIASCSGPKKATIKPASDQLVVDGKLWSSAFQQRAAEYKALCIQAFNIARLRLDESLQKAGLNPNRPLAIITDIDETFLDNSPYAVHQAIQGKDYEPSAWYEWTSKGMADTLAGSLTFYNYAASKNVTVFYITNRDEKDRDGTLSNLQHFYFPFADNQHLIVKQTGSSKEERRLKVMANYDVVMLLGDNLADFSSLFDSKTEAERDQNVERLAPEFGKKFIVLPNANYGGWEDAMYENSHNWTPAQKDSLIKSKLKGF